MGGGGGAGAHVPFVYMRCCYIWFFWSKQTAANCRLYTGGLLAEDEKIPHLGNTGRACNGLNRDGKSYLNAYRIKTYLPEKYRFTNHFQYG